jgi:RNA-binding protein
LKILGTVLHTSGHKNLIVRGAETKKEKMGLPKINSTVIDKKMKKIGKINDVFGPVKCPYFSVRIFKNVSNESLREYRNSHVYIA